MTEQLVFVVTVVMLSTGLSTFLTILAIWKRVPPDAIWHAGEIVAVKAQKEVSHLQLLLF